MSLTTTDGLSPVAITATDPAISRTRSAVTASKSRLAGASTVQCGMTHPPRRYHCLTHTICRKPGKSRCIAFVRRWGGAPRPFWIRVLLLFLACGVVVRVGVGIGVLPRQPGREPVHRGLELRIEVNEGPEALGEPGHADLLV